MEEFYELLEWIAYITAVLGWEDNETTAELAPDEEEAVSGLGLSLSLGDVFNSFYGNTLNTVEMNNFNAEYETGQSLYEASFNKPSFDKVGFDKVSFDEVSSEINSEISSKISSEISFNTANSLTDSVLTYLSTFDDNSGLTYTQITNTFTENADKLTPMDDGMWTDNTAWIYDTANNQSSEVLTNAVSVAERCNALYSKNNILYNALTDNSSMPFNFFNYSVTDNLEQTAFNQATGLDFEGISSYYGNYYNNNFDNNFNKAVAYKEAVYEKAVYNNVAGDRLNGFNISDFDSKFYNTKSLDTELISDYGIDNSSVYEGGTAGKALLSRLVNGNTANYTDVKPSVNINVDFKAYANIKNDYDTEHFTQVFVNKLREELTEYAEGIHF
jgi:hypothetical protein